jgi:hypothetical protein
MLYLKPDEVNTWAPRTPVDDEQLTSMALIASAMADAYLGRRLDIIDYRMVVTLGSGLAGYIGPVPIVDVSLVRVRRTIKVVGGGHAASAEGWVNLSADDVANMIDYDTGRIELYSFQWDGYQRITDGRRSVRHGYQAEVTFKAGYMASTEVAADTDAGETTIRVVSTENFTIGDRVTVGPYATLYKIKSLDGGQIELETAIENEVVEGDEISERVPTDIKAACGAIVEDLQTWLPTAIQQSETLSIIEDSNKRTTGHPIPPTAAAMLAKYKRWSWV